MKAIRLYEEYRWSSRLKESVMYSLSHDITLQRDVTQKGGIR
jgi:hypothetical protein